MKNVKWFVVIAALFSLFVLFSCRQKEKTPEVTQEELTAAVPELDDLHSAVYPLWHQAYPEKDYQMIKELVPQLDSLSAILDNVQLPGILRDKQEAWDKQKEILKATLAKLKKAANTNNKEDMLAQTEAFHSAYEKLVRTIRPMVKELDAFHQEMYKLFHYYLPNYDLTKIRETVAAMQAKLPALKQAQLNKRLQDKKMEFDAAVEDLETEVNKLAEVVKKDDREAIKAAVDAVHTAYQGCEAIFD